MEHDSLEEPDNVHRFWYDPDSDASVTNVILEGASEVKGEPISGLETLQYSIDTDSLESIFCPLQSGGFGAIGELKFMYDGLMVEVHSSGSIHIIEQ